jgi:hypothetical protein
MSNNLQADAATRAFQIATGCVKDQFRSTVGGSANGAPATTARRLRSYASGPTSSPRRWPMLQNSKHMHGARRVETTIEFLCTTRVQNGGGNDHRVCPLQYGATRH